LLDIVTCPCSFIY